MSKHALSQKCKKRLKFEEKRKNVIHQVVNYKWENHMITSIDIDSWFLKNLVDDWVVNIQCDI